MFVLLAQSWKQKHPQYKYIQNHTNINKTRQVESSIKQTPEYLNKTNAPLFGELKNQLNEQYNYPPEHY